MEVQEATNNQNPVSDPVKVAKPKVSVAFLIVVLISLFVLAGLVAYVMFVKAPKQVSVNDQLDKAESLLDQVSVEDFNDDPDLSLDESKNADQDSDSSQSTSDAGNTSNSAKDAANSLNNLDSSLDSLGSDFNETGLEDL